MTSVGGGGEFSSPVTVYLREPSDYTNQSGLIAGVTVSVIVLLLGLLVAAITTYIIFW